MQIKRTEATRAKLIDAAIAQIETHGVNTLTLDAVAREAGVSKGGLLHHFPSKDALVEAILRRIFSLFEDQMEALYQDETRLNGDAPGRLLRAYVRATFDESDDIIPMNVVIGLMTTLAENETLLALAHADTERWSARLAADGIPLGRAMVIQAAADMLWVSRAMGETMTIEAITAMREELMALTRRTE